MTEKHGAPPQGRRAEPETQACEQGAAATRAQMSRQQIQTRCRGGGKQRRSEGDCDPKHQMVERGELAGRDRRRRIPGSVRSDHGSAYEWQCHQRLAGRFFRIVGAVDHGLVERVGRELVDAQGPILQQREHQPHAADDIRVWR
jgi:hypothetical protein